MLMGIHGCQIAAQVIVTDSFHKTLENLVSPAHDGFIRESLHSQTLEGVQVLHLAFALVLRSRIEIVADLSSVGASAESPGQQREHLFGRIAL